MALTSFGRLYWITLLHDWHTAESRLHLVYTGGTGNPEKSCSVGFPQNPKLHAFERQNLRKELTRFEAQEAKSSIKTP